MRHFILFYLLIFVCHIAIAHQAHYDNSSDHKWTIDKNGKSYIGTFLLCKNNEVYIESQEGTTIHFPITQLSLHDKEFVSKAMAEIENLNKHNSKHSLFHSHNKPSGTGFNWSMILTLALAFLLLFGISLYILLSGQSHKWIKTAFLFSIVFLLAFKSHVFFGTDPLIIDEAFKPFKHKVNTFWDENYFYVESDGIPDHTMMKDITSWQQQVPIPQCYTGTNSWQIPLNPEPATDPIPVDNQHFLRGAIAIASNGIPIFNPHTNTGVDALEDGQLDIYGGHSGRADDYHYHVAPLHLHTLNQTKETLPIAYSLDGYAVYGNVEQDGSPMKPLDENHGHIGSDGVYHYHGTKEKPYMIARMFGKVTESADKELIPQPRAKGVRPALTPLKDAVITDCVPNANGKGFDLSYEINNVPYAVNYSWTNDGKFTYNFVSPTGTTVQNYTGNPLCKINTAVLDISNNNSILIFPNPTSDCINIKLNEEISPSDILVISMFDLQGKLIFSYNKYIDTNCLPFTTSPGVFVLKLETKMGNISKKILVK